MLGKLALLLKGKLAAAVLGTVLLAGGGTTAVLAANGTQLQLPLVSQAASQEHQGNDAFDDHGSDQGSSRNDDANEAQDNDQHENELSGTVASINPSSSSFVLKQSSGATKTVVVSAKTVFDGGLQGLSDLKVGQLLEVKGNLQSDGTLAATRVHGEDNDATDDRGGNSGPGSSGSGGSGRGGHDDTGVDN